MVRPVRTDETLGVQANVNQMRRLLDSTASFDDEGEVTAVEYPPVEPRTATGLTRTATNEVANAAVPILTAFSTNAYRLAALVLLAVTIVAVVALYLAR